MDDELRIKKQSYLQTEILDKGIDPGHFQEYCEKIKGEESDLDKWSFEEIVQLVNQYKIEFFTTEFDDQPDDGLIIGWDAFDQVIPQLNTKSDPQDWNLLDLGTIQNTQPVVQAVQIATQIQAQQILKQEIAVNLPEKIQPEKILPEKILPEKMQPEKLEVVKVAKPIAVSPTAKRISEIQKQIPSKKAPEVFSFSQCSQLQCKKLGFNIFAQGVPPIKIIGSEKKTGGLFKSDYVAYTVTTGDQYTVQRRYSDFEWLQATLHKLFPGIGIPCLCEKTAKKTSSNTIQKRSIMLELFLNELAKSEQFRNSKYFVDFLRLSDQQQFKQLLKFGEKLSRPNKFESLLNMTGSVVFVPDIKLNNFEIFIQQEEPIYVKIKNQFKSITSHLSAISKIIKDIEDEFKTLTELCQKFEINQDYDPLLDMTRKLEEQINKCSANQYNKMYNMFRYQTLNFSQIKGIIKIRNELQQEFNNRKDFKVEQISELYNSRENTKSMDELEFPAKSSKLLAYQLGFMNWRTIEEIKVFLQNRQTGFQAYAQSILS